MDEKNEHDLQILVNWKNAQINELENLIKIKKKLDPEPFNFPSSVKFIKYNDYKLLLKQLELIKTNSKQVIESNITYDNVYNRALLKFNDYVTRSTQDIFVYFSKAE